MPASSAIPVAKGLPLLGNAIGLAGDVRAFLLECYQTIGPVFKVTALNFHYTVLAGFEANQFLIREGAKYLRSKEFWQENDQAFGASRSLISMDGPEHARYRKVQKKGYSCSLLEGRVDEISQLSQEEVRANHYE